MNVTWETSIYSKECIAIPFQYFRSWLAIIFYIYSIAFAFFIYFYFDRKDRISAKTPINFSQTQISYSTTRDFINWANWNPLHCLFYWFVNINSLMLKYKKGERGVDITSSSDMRLYCAEQDDENSSAWSLKIYLKGRKENTFIPQKVIGFKSPT